MMTNFKVGQYSVYTNGPYPANFQKLYKGVLVVVENSGGDARYMYLAIRTKETRTCIWKRGSERLDQVVFSDKTFTVTCVFDKAPENHCQTSLTFEKEVYEELKANIPEYMEEQGVRFTVKSIGARTVLSF